MASSPKLSSEEVSALIEGLNRGEFGASADALPEVEFKAYQLGQEDAGLLGGIGATE